MRSKLQGEGIGKLARCARLLRPLQTPISSIPERAGNAAAATIESASRAWVFKYRRMLTWSLPDTTGNATPVT